MRRDAAHKTFLIGMSAAAISFYWFANWLYWLVIMADWLIFICYWLTISLYWFYSD